MYLQYLTPTVHTLLEKCWRIRCMRLMTLLQSTMCRKVSSNRRKWSKIYSHRASLVEPVQSWPGSDPCDRLRKFLKKQIQIKSTVWKKGKYFLGFFTSVFFSFLLWLKFDSNYKNCRHFATTEPLGHTATAWSRSFFWLRLQQKSPAPAPQHCKELSISGISYIF